MAKRSWSHLKKYWFKKGRKGRKSTERSLRWHARGNTPGDVRADDAGATVVVAARVVARPGVGPQGVESLRSNRMPR
jgi:hypothetical protein